MSTLDLPKVTSLVDAAWEADIKDSLFDFISVPNQSPSFDPHCLTNGLQEQALDVVMKWVSAQKIKGLESRTVTCEGRTPVIFMTIAPTDPSVTSTVFCYGHLDKQPPMLPWDEGLGPYSPKIITGPDCDGNVVEKLMGRGGADDGYSIYSLITSLRAVQEQGLAHGRVAILLEFAEESGSVHLDYYLETLKDEIGNNIDLVICTDSGSMDYSRFWLTSSLRGMVGLTVEVQVADSGTHSGFSSGVIPSSFRVLRSLLDRIEDSTTGKLLIPSAYTVIPDEQLEYARQTGDIIKNNFFTAFPITPGVKPVSEDVFEAYLNKSWRPTVSYTGIAGIPAPEQAGNVLRPSTTMVLSIRLPPTADPAQVFEEINAKLTTDVPYNAKVTISNIKKSSGFYAPAFEPWLVNSCQRASTSLWDGNTTGFISDGVSIPFLNVLQASYPKAQFAVVGLLGPGSCAHGPNEMMHVPYFKKLTVGLSQIFVDHHQAKVAGAADSTTV